MYKSVCILGRLSAIGCAELERLYGAAAVLPVETHAALVDLPSDQIDFARLGGSIKLCDVVEVVDMHDWHSLQLKLITVGAELATELPQGKVQLGISAYGLKFSPRQLTAAGLELKKTLRQAGRSVRLVSNQTVALNSAQVLHNHLVGERGLELVLINHGLKTIVARTVAEQDIAAYTARDRGRPKRDARVGMLPPKLAQILVNLATGQRPPSAAFTILDPFCGTGVVLQEALLMGYSVYGSDIEQRMVDYSIANVNGWLHRTKYPDLPGVSTVARGDATSHQWKTLHHNFKTERDVWSPVQIDAVASETYLGQPFSDLPSPQKLRDVRQTCDTILEKFLKNIGAQLKTGIPLCLAVPAWQEEPGHFIHLPLLDHLGDLGYNRIDFKHVRHSELIYYRPDQIVGRELVVITRK